MNKPVMQLLGCLAFALPFALFLHASGALVWAQVNQNTGSETVAGLVPDGEPSNRKDDPGYTGVDRIAAVMIEPRQPLKPQAFGFSVAVPVSGAARPKDVCLQIMTQINENDRSLEFTSRQQFHVEGEQPRPAYIHIDPVDNDLFSKIEQRSPLAVVRSGGCVRSSSRSLYYYPVGWGDRAELNLSRIHIYFQPVNAKASVEFVTVRTHKEPEQKECRPVAKEIRYSYVCKVDGTNVSTGVELDVIIRENLRREIGRDEPKFKEHRILIGLPTAAGL